MTIRGSGIHLFFPPFLLLPFLFSFLSSLRPSVLLSTPTSELFSSVYTHNHRHCYLLQLAKLIHAQSIGHHLLYLQSTTAIIKIIKFTIPTIITVPIHFQSSSRQLHHTSIPAICNFTITSINFQFKAQGVPRSTQGSLGLPFTCNATKSQQPNSSSTKLITCRRRPVSAVDPEFPIDHCSSPRFTVESAFPPASLTITTDEPNFVIPISWSTDQTSTAQPSVPQTTAPSRQHQPSLAHTELGSPAPAPAVQKMDVKPGACSSGRAGLHGAGIASGPRRRRAEEMPRAGLHGWRRCN